MNNVYAMPMQKEKIKPRAAQEDLLCIGDQFGPLT